MRLPSFRRATLLAAIIIVANGVIPALWILLTSMKTETELILKSRWADPRRLREEGFRWRWPQLTGALADLEGRLGLDGFFYQPERRSAGVRVWTPGKKVAAGFR